MNWLMNMEMDSYCEKIILEGVEGGLYLIYFIIYVNF